LIFQNGIRGDGIKALMPSLAPSAQSGALSHLDFNDNQTSDKDDVVKAIEDLISVATNLRTLSISDSGISSPKLQQRLVQTIIKSPSAECFEELFWNFDITFARLAELILNDLITLPKIKKVKLIGTVHNKEKRAELRKIFNDKGAKLLLSEWEQTAEELALEGKEIDEEDIFSEDESDEEWDSQEEDA
jgi:hypothetical protein